MNALIIHAQMSWKRKPVILQSTLCTNPPGKTCGISGNSAWKSSWKPNRNNGHARNAVISSLSIQAHAADAANSIRKHCDGAKQILNKEIKGMEAVVFGQKIKVYHIGETTFLYDK